ncbi:MAG TPA: hypothetical protein VFV86_12005 [Nitrososphaeraceae archaeon]|nr:hypothetical protein [Nitrososphaeraceae archaeon]
MIRRNIMGRRFKNAESLEIKNLILHCYCIGYSINQTRTYIQIKKGVKLEYQYVKNVRNKYVNGAADWLLELAQDKTAFIARFRDKIMQLESYRQSLMDLIFQDPNQCDQDQPKISPAIHIKAIDSLHKITLSLLSLEKMLPLVTRFSKDMDIDELLKLNNVYKDELSITTSQAFGEERNVSLRPQYMDIEQMVNGVLRQYQKNMKSNDITAEAKGTVSEDDYKDRFSAII